MTKSANTIRLALVALFLACFAQYAPAAPSVNVSSNASAGGAAFSASLGNGVAAHGATSTSRDVSGATGTLTTLHLGPTTVVIGTTVAGSTGATGNLVGGFGFGGAIAGGSYNGSATAHSH